MTSINAILRDGSNVDMPALRQYLADQNASVNAANLAISTGTVAAAVGDRLYATQAALFADLAPADDLFALVFADADYAKNGLYQKNGASTAGSWIGPFDLFSSAAEALVQPLADLAAVSAVNAEEAAAVVVDAVADAVDARDIVEALRNYYATRSAGAAATASGGIFTSDEEGSMAWYRSTGDGSYVRIDFAATKTITDAIDTRGKRNERVRPLGTLLRHRRFRRTLGSINGYTSAGTPVAASIASVSDFPYDPPFGLAPNILTQKVGERRKVTGIATPAPATTPNFVTVTCDRAHGLVAGDRVRFFGSTFPGTSTINTDENEQLFGADGAQGAKVPYPSVTPADVLAGLVAKGIDVFDAPSEKTFRVKIAAGLEWSDTTSDMWWEPLPRFWPASDPVFDWVVPGRRDALPRNNQSSGRPSFGTVSTGEIGASGAGATTNAQVKIGVVEFMLYEDVMVLCSRSAKFRVFADGVPVHNGVLNVASPDSPGYRTTFTFADARDRLIRIETTNAPSSTFVGADIFGIWTRGRNAIGPARAKEQRRPLMLLCGDSFVEGEGIPNWHLSFGALMGERLGWDVIHGGLGSTGLTTPGVHGAGNDYGSRMALMKIGGIEPDLICVLNSLNDFGDVTEVLATRFIDRMRALWPNAELIVLGSGYPTETPTEARLASDAAWLAAANARGVPFIDGGIGTTGAAAWLTAGNKETFYHGTRATATASVSSGAVSSIAVATAGSGYDPANGVPTVSFSGGGGSGATATATVNYKVTDLQIINGGQGYTSATLTIGHGAYASAIESGGEITGVMINNRGGVIWTSPPPITFSGGGGSGAAATAVLEGGVLVAINVTNPGSGYSSAPTVNIGICSGVATATATIVDGVIRAASITSAGDLYTDTPICIVTGDGYGAEIVPFLSGTVTSIAVTAGGTGYTSAPTVTVAHPNGDDITHPKPNGHRLMAHRYSAGIEQLLAA